MMCSPGEKTSLIIVWTKRPLLSKISIEIRSFSGTENLNVIFGLNGFGKGEERKKEFVQVLLWSGVGIVSIVTYVPKGTSITNIILAIVSFFIILYLAIRALKYFKFL